MVRVNGVRLQHGEKQERLAEFYEGHLISNVLPFWLRTGVDFAHGGVFTCFDNAGIELKSRDKYTWSQGRFAWMAARIADLGRRGRVCVNPDEYLEMANRTVKFLRNHVFLENGHVAFLLDEYGHQKAMPGQDRLDVSIYADCFVALAFLEVSRVTNDANLREQAWNLYLNCSERIRAHDYLIEPYPVPDAITVHGLPMILLNLSVEFCSVFQDRQDPHLDEARRHSAEYVSQILRQLDVKTGLILEHVPLSIMGANEWKFRMLCRHAAPGHTAESVWLMMHAAVHADDFGLLKQCSDILVKTFAAGWDEEYGGLYRFVGTEGPRTPPVGDLIGIPYEDQILDTWDMKLWWVHSEFLYASRLAATLMDDKTLSTIADRVHEYTFATFPNPDASVGEWIQKRDRAGKPLDKLVALPVKDPYHITRDLLLLIDLLR